MQIVVLDGYTLNPGDLDWKPLKSLGEVKIYDRTPQEKIIKRAKDAQIIFTNKTVLNEKVLSQLPEVKYIGVLATGYNVVDISYCKKHKIIVTNVPGYGPKTVAQMVFAHILEFTNHVYEHHLSVLNGEWSQKTDFCYWKYPLIELSNKTLGIIGYGQIGKEVALLGHAFGMNILVNTRTVPKTAPNYVKFVSLKKLANESDFISLNCPLTPTTHHLINKNFFQQMKQSAFIINCGRGQLINEKDLKYALETKQIAGAGIDVLSQEPPPKNHPLFKCPNIHFTPHIAWATKEARQRLLNIAIENLAAFLQGKPQNIVN
ncbi:glycerate dehydrogenase [Desulfonauticus submarinus]|uniref:Glycerate dehydrogenase n=1 Tax=Desulfonauticus submarinus TaxID=206665 RepID=A0A1H0FXH1_9BACT|nr:D-2-hydroxyacid dehydrogenase [Desulfonauticus submarinus]SDN99272.1 glycerate dehydrogenase [Desulfonauticus submarinus]